jgi:hypothetical protein
VLAYFARHGGIPAVIEVRFLGVLGDAIELFCARLVNPAVGWIARNPVSWIDWLTAEAACGAEAGRDGGADECALLPIPTVRVHPHIPARVACDGVAAPYRLTATNTLRIIPRVDDSEGIDLLGHKVLAHQRSRVKCAVVAGRGLRRQSLERDVEEFREALRSLALGENGNFDTAVRGRLVPLLSFLRRLQGLLVL